MSNKIPDSPFKISSKDCRAGSKKQDLRALAAILVAWQVGVDTFMEAMKKINLRKRFIELYVEDQCSNKWVQELAQGTLLNPEGCLTLAQIKKIMGQYLSTLPPLKQEGN